MFITRLMSIFVCLRVVSLPRLQMDKYQVGTRNSLPQFSSCRTSISGKLIRINYVLLILGSRLLPVTISCSP